MRDACFVYLILSVLLFNNKQVLVHCLPATTKKPTILLNNQLNLQIIQNNKSSICHSCSIYDGVRAQEISYTKNIHYVMKQFFTLERKTKSALVVLNDNCF